MQVKKRVSLPPPPESEEQQALFAWAKLQHYRYPELDLLYHIPNEGKRSLAAGVRLRAEGLKAGVPDICLPAAHGGFHGLYIELKRRRGGTVTEDQTGWIEALSKQGYRAAVCRGWEEAARVILDYIKQEIQP